MWACHWAGSRERCVWGREGGYLCRCTSDDMDLSLWLSTRWPAWWLCWLSWHKVRTLPTTHTWTSQVRDLPSAAREEDSWGGGRAAVRQQEEGCFQNWVKMTETVRERKNKWKSRVKKELPWDVYWTFRESAKWAAVFRLMKEWETEYFPLKRWEREKERTWTEETDSVHSHLMLELQETNPGCFTDLTNLRLPLEA